MDLLKVFKPKPYIKIENKSFDDLSSEELAYMILADSSLTKDGNEYFDSMALDEFLTIEIVKNKDLLELKDFINNNLYIETESDIKDIDRAFLRKLASNLFASEDIQTAISKTKKELNIT